MPYLSIIVTVSWVYQCFFIRVAFFLGFLKKKTQGCGNAVKKQTKSPKIAKKFGFLKENFLGRRNTGKNMNKNPRLSNELGILKKKLQGLQNPAKKQAKNPRKTAPQQKPGRRIQRLAARITATAAAAIISAEGISATAE